nr:DUF4258 domain-containing protein [uncultured Brevundimonas sp.]
MTIMFHNQAGRLRALVAAGAAVFYRKHALKEMENDGIVRIDVESMMRACRVTLVEQSQGEETWRAEGADFNGRDIAAVVVPYEDDLEIKVITAWAVK